MKSIRYSLPDLPYSYSALEPIISAEIMRLHHDKHHLAYVNGANAAIEALEKSRSGDMTINVKSTLASLSFNLNGHLLHELFWRTMREPSNSNTPTSSVEALFKVSFSSYDAFKNEFALAAKTVEGSGWAILAKDSANNLFVQQVEKHNLMHVAGFTPVLALDVWEHAYYLDYKNDRAAYVEKWWAIVNWNEVEKLLES